MTLTAQNTTSGIRMLAADSEPLDNLRNGPATPPFDWPAHLLSTQPLVLRPEKPLNQAKRYALRITLALDSRTEFTLRLFRPDYPNEALLIDVRQGGMLQPFQIELPQTWTNSGKDLRFALSSNASPAPTILAHSPVVPSGHGPVLVEQNVDLSAEEKIDALWTFLASPNSLQPFGWCEGCILDALADRAEAGTLQPTRVLARLRRYFHDDGAIVYWDHLSRRRANAFYGIEAAHPFATLARIAPEHSALPRIADFLLNHRSADGLIADRGKVTAEGFLVVSYVLAILGKTLDREEWIEIAREQALRRTAILLKNGSICQRVTADGKRHGELWARGVGWFLLGLARTLPILRETEHADRSLEDAYRAASAIARRYQRPDGLWNCFLNDPASEPETSGSSAIAAGLALNPLGENPACDLDSTVDSLVKALTPDGCLTGISQLNKGGDALQRSGYRVMAHFGTGLCGQFLQAHHDPSPFRAIPA